MRNTVVIAMIVGFVLVLTGCSDNDTAEKMQEAINNNDYFTAKQTYEDASEDKSEAQKEKLNQAVSNMLVKELQKDFKAVEKDSGKEAAFYHSLSEIEEIGIDSETLTDKINSYKQELEIAEGVRTDEAASTAETDSSSTNDDFEVRFNYERKITAEFLELIELWGNVNDGSEKLNRLGYQQSVQELSSRLLADIEYYRTAISIPEDQEEVYQFYFGYLDEIEQAIKKLDKASYSNDNSLFKEVRIHILAASDYHDSFTISSRD
ncbi:hypothetical protein [Metabacillus idriensis]|uniref:hypothetical protein n=1 Tax=Metabacillus idriensis TaxID=324768 RepID=UPI003D2C74BF